MNKSVVNIWNKKLAFLPAYLYIFYDEKEFSPTGCKLDEAVHELYNLKRWRD